jgi:Arc-like DNA binding domain
MPRRRRLNVTTLTLKNVPETLVEQLKEGARQNRRSLNQEALMRLEESLVTRRRGGTDVAAELRRLHQQLADIPPLTDAFLRSAKNEGRP